MPAVVFVMLYTWFVGWGLLFRWVRPDNAYLYMALPCIAPIGWYLYGFLNITEGKQDFGLLLSAAGWALVALALLIKQGAINSARAAGADATDALASAGNSPAATVCAVLALLFLVLGGLLSWQAWKQQISSGQGVTD